MRTTPPVIPCLQTLKKTSCILINHNGNILDCWFFNDIDRLVNVWPDCNQNKDSVSVLWLGFLKYYIEFDWGNMVVNINSIDKLPREGLKWGNKIHPMAVVDPFDFTHNLTAGVTQNSKNLFSN